MPVIKLMSEVGKKEVRGKVYLLIARGSLFLNQLYAQSFASVCEHLRKFDLWRVAYEPFANWKL